MGYIKRDEPDEEKGWKLGFFVGENLVENGVGKKRDLILGSVNF